MITQTGNLINDDADSAVSWKAILAGSTANIAITLVMIAFGIGVGFSVVSPWAGQGISEATFTIAAGIYLIAIAMIASTIGGYLAGRLRTQWSSVHEHERYFRDSAHGFLTWAFAMVVGAAVLGGAFTSIVSARTGMTQADAEQRVNQVITQAKTAADDARKSTAKFALWLVVSMLAGALSASLAAIEGGNLRNREWYLVGAARTRVVVSPAE